MWYFTWILGVLLACAFGTTPKFWLNGQATFELAVARRQDKLRNVGPIAAKAV